MQIFKKLLQNFRHLLLNCYYLYASAMRRGEVRRFRWVWMLVVALLLAAPVAGCSASAQVPGTTVTVTPRTSVADQPVQIRVAGLSGGQRAPVQVSSTDAAGMRWQASAVYRADAAGATGPE